MEANVSSDESHIISPQSRGLKLRPPGTGEKTLFDFKLAQCILHPSFLGREGARENRIRGAYFGAGKL
jgi:hypothetical protein